MLVPIRAQDRAAPGLIGDGTVVRPRMHFEPSIAFGAAIAEELTWPPALEVSATPHADFFHSRQFQCAVDPAAAAPTRRPDIPVRMIIERDEHERFGQGSNPESGE